MNYSQLLWPLSFAEQNLAVGNGIGPQDIASYEYPPGRLWRYKEPGWKKALALGVAFLDVRDFMIANADEPSGKDSERASAWDSVFEQLLRHNPEFCQKPSSGLHCALDEIRRLQKS